MVVRRPISRILVFFFCVNTCFLFGVAKFLRRFSSVILVFSFFYELSCTRNNVLNSYELHNNFMFSYCVKYALDTHLILKLTSQFHLPFHRLIFILLRNYTLNSRFVFFFEMKLFTVQESTKTNYKLSDEK